MRKRGPSRALSRSLTVAALILGLVLHAAGDQAFSAEPPRGPNIVIILADDLGYGDLGCHGSPTVKTPRLDRLAAEGARLTDFYAAAPFCSPSRAALLTGRYPARCGLPYVLFPAEHTGLPAAEVTLAGLLRGRGYATACVGKWHLGWDRPFRPQRHAFDVFFGLPYSNDMLEWAVGTPFRQTSGLEPLPLMDGDRVVEAPVDQATLTRRYTERAVRFIRQHRDRPFFLYLPHTMPHIPQYASEKFAGKSRGGVYGDCIEELDWSTGVILDTLRELRLAEQTLVVFTSDNGAVVRPAAARGKGQFGERGNGGSVGPLRGGKGTTFEGGVRVPGLFWWPGQVPPGQVVHEPASALDLFPTVARLAGAELPRDRVYDGRDLLPRLRGRRTEGEPPPFYYFFGVQLQAVRQERWKLFLPVESYPKPAPRSLWYDHNPQLLERHHRLWPKPVLYDLDQDVGETTDVAGQHPDVVQRLAKLARDFDKALQRDKRAPVFLDGPRPPAPGQVRRPDEDLSAWSKWRATPENSPR